MTRELSVRAVRDDELEAAGELVAGAYRDQPGMHDEPGYLEKVRDARARATDAEVLVAVDGDGTIVGCVSYVGDASSPLAELQGPDEAGFRMLGVAEPARRRGVARALVAACVERARAAGRRGIVILTEPRWTDSHRTYERLGFRRAPDRDWEPEPGLVLWAWVLDL